MSMGTGAPSSACNAVIEQADGEHICELPKGHEGDHKCQCGDYWKQS